MSDKTDFSQINSNLPIKKETPDAFITDGLKDVDFAFYKGYHVETKFKI